MTTHKASVSRLVKTVRRGALTKYDPQKGVKQIAVAAMAQKHYTKARNAEKVEHAVRWKWDLQAEFVLWWDTEANKDDGGRPLKTGSKNTTGFDKLQDFSLDKFVVHEWRKVCVSPAKFEAAVTADTQHALARIERERREKRVSQNSGEHEWYTPEAYIEAARDVMGAIDLDPATSKAANAVVKAAQIFTSADSGLKHPWHGCVWMNPPYSQPLVQQFTDKLAEHVRSGDVSAAVVLINNATETEFFQTLAGVSMAVCFPKGRVRFWSPGKDSATPLQGQAVLYTGADVELFCNRFTTFGVVGRFVRAL